ncbi:MAG: hypothetical protein RLZZ540_591 [Bacteroidota bacterium]|jgi:hypothetical protein
MSKNFRVTFDIKMLFNLNTFIVDANLQNNFINPIELVEFVCKKLQNSVFIRL